MESNLKKDLAFEGTSLKDRSFRILLVEDNPGDVLIINELLKASGIDFSLAHLSTLKETLLLCVEREFDVILLDLGLPDSIGVETLKKIQVCKMKSPVVVMTGLDDEDVALESLREGAQDYLVKSRLTSDNILRGIKYAIERKKIQDLLEKSARQFSLLSSTTEAINECEDISDVFAVTCRNISKLLDKASIISFELDDPAKIYTSGIEDVEPWLDQIKQTTGLNLHHPDLHFNDKRTEIMNLLSDGKLHKITYEFQNYSIPDSGKEDPAKSGKIYDINIYAIGFTRTGTIHGGALIFTRNIIGIDDVSIIETVSNQVSLSLHRKTIEQDLKESENRYRKLSKELEMKVRERTRDIENSNYQLNQELVERHSAEEALKRSEARLIELNATKDKFFSIIAHDLKNPFTCLLGSTELLTENIDQMDNGTIRELAQVLNDSAKSGYAILQNLLDWSRSQTGMITFNPENIDLKNLVDENISEFRLFSTKKGIDVISEIQEEMNIFADRNMINAVLRNLLGNAIKFTPRFGTVMIGAIIKDSEVTVSVKDTGIGIPKENINELFRIDTKFTRPGTNKEQGTGLGLKLCKEFIEMQGGKIWVKSAVNKGSEFIFSIPLKNI
jgi:signal transduction histidine kinase/DNA-binding NarL/FixJ family response regulator